MYSSDKIIRNSMEYYDKNKEKTDILKSKLRYIKFSYKDYLNDKILFYDKNKELILESKIQLLSIYYPKNNIWKWSWSIPSAHKNSTFLVRKILDYAFDLNNESEFMLKYLLLNSQIKIINDLQLDINLALSSYISKIPFIFEYNMIPVSANEDDLIDYKDDILNSPYLPGSMSAYFLILDYKE
jgi:hypothetical protein